MMEKTYREEMKDDLGVFLIIEVMEPEDWISLDWIGYIDERRAKKGMLHYLEIMENFKLTKLLNDNRKERGPYPEDIGIWIQNVWLSRALQIKLQYGATIVSPMVFGRISADMIVRQINGITMRNFENAVDAKQWLINLK